MIESASEITQVAIPTRLSNLELVDTSRKQERRHKSPEPKKLPTDRERGSSKLLANFQPAPYTVIVGNGGRSLITSTGNQRLTILVAAQLDSYCNTSSRAVKSRIVSDIYEAIKKQCPTGAFVKCNGDGQWWELSEYAAREKISSKFRDLLGHKYKSSCVNKVARKRARRLKAKHIQCESETSSCSSFSSCNSNADPRATSDLLPPSTPASDADIIFNDEEDKIIDSDIGVNVMWNIFGDGSNKNCYEY